MKISVITPSIRPVGLEVTRDSLLNQTFKDFEWIVDINWTGQSDLNASLNRCIKRASGELIVFLQDFIIIENDGLERFWKAYQENKEVLYTAPVGKIDNGKIIWDWRKSRVGECNWQEWEIDWGACAKDIIYDIGGFDEALDEAWGFDNVNAGLRADLRGYKFLCLSNNPAKAFDHDKHTKHPFRNLRNPELHNYRLDQIRRGLEIRYL